ncbi:methyl-accepting chemotaxis protein [Rhodoblastus acidophilus]|uniref:methyl-accepting chemotaxis protein n=1 Tax=Rhodoblastus acidophilus TaxID=1074 RepID=UPI00222559AD|nr:methyl-accepting chemotaxis protein [Rhodoblastus acidophilus]MCW2286733.1 methyl-accepting chemotaxis protein [Rhodoblastus acidophilus]MCW2335560.1 methyl-accepting chemotaxis protein [Rhodoblastus acidophilus]
MPLSRLARSRFAASTEDEPALLPAQIDGVIEDVRARLASDPAQAALSSLLPDLRAHWRELVAQPTTEDQVLRARRIGEAQARAALSPKTFVETYGLLTSGLVRGALGRQSREAALVGRVLDMVFADMAASFDAYVSGCDSVSREKEAAELLRAVDAEMVASNAAAETQSGAMRAIVADLEKVIGELRGGVALVTDGAATASQSIGAVAAAVEELHASSQEVGRQANDANALVHDAVTRADGAEQRFSDLASCAARVTEIVTLISGISSQTSLLALNATIEAARAGESGRGFAVVANEVKSLAQRTSVATRDIATQIGEIETAVRSSVASMKEVRDIIGRIAEIASAVARSSDQQIGAIQEVGQSANSAAQGAAQLGGSVDLFNGAVGEADEATEKVASQSRQVSALSAHLTKRLSVTLKNFVDVDQRKFPRSPAKIAARLNFRGQTVSAEVLEISEGSALVNGVPLQAGDLVELALQDIGAVRARALPADFGVRLLFTETPKQTAAALKALMDRLLSRERALRDIVISRAAMISTLFEKSLAAGAIAEADLFDVNYIPIPGTNPQQFRNRALAFLEANLPAIQEPILALDSAIVFSAAVDHNGYLPVHNKKYSAPQGPDPVWNNANSRNRRIFDDMTGLMAGRNTAESLSQTYPRDLGGGQVALIKDISAPIFVRGKHWGGLRMGAKIA